MTTNFNRKKKVKPGELYRYDLITAMLLPDSAYLKEDSYITISDEWKSEWSNPVQVPIQDEPSHKPEFKCIPSCEIPLNPVPSLEALKPVVKGKRSCSLSNTSSKRKSKDIVKPEISYRTLNYDLDDLDTEWLNGLRNTPDLSISELTDDVFEFAIEFFERKSFERALNEIGKLGREHDDSTICEICRSTEIEEENDIIFCDVCDVAVHQACYGVKEVPCSSWLCAPCSQQTVNPMCALCGKMKGPMKLIRGSKDWVHIICAWWIPEVVIEDSENVEDIDISRVSASRFALVCSICHSPGACIQCSRRNCTQAYHISCGVRVGLYFDLDCNEDDTIKHTSYCMKHSRGLSGRFHWLNSISYQNFAPRCPHNHSHDINTSHLPSQSISGCVEEPQSFICDPYECLRDGMIQQLLTVCSVLSESTATILYNYWVRKKKYMNGVPLIDVTEISRHHQAKKMCEELQDMRKIRMNLEKLRILCCLCAKREKTKEEGIVLFERLISHKMNENSEQSKKHKKPSIP